MLTESIASLRSNGKSDGWDDRSCPECQSDLTRKMRTAITGREMWRSG